MSIWGVNIRQHTQSEEGQLKANTKYFISTCLCAMGQGSSLLPCPVALQCCTVRPVGDCLQPGTHGTMLMGQCQILGIMGQ